MNRPLIEAWDLNTINVMFRNAYEQLMNVIGVGKLDDESRPSAYAQISSKTMVGAILDQVAAQVDFAKYSGAVRYADSTYMSRRIIYLVACMIPAVADYFANLFGSIASEYRGDDRAKAVFARNWFAQVAETARVQDRDNPLCQAADVFAKSMYDTVKTGVKSRRQTAVDDDNTANAEVTKILDGLTADMNETRNMVYDILRAVDLSPDSVSSDRVSKVVWIIYTLKVLEAYKETTYKQNNRRIDTYSGILSHALLSEPGISGVAGSDYVLKSFQNDTDVTNQHATLSDTTRFTAKTVVKLFIGNFSKMVALYPASASTGFSGRPDRVSRNDIMNAVQLIFNHLSPRIKKEQVTPEFVDNYIRDTLALDTRLALNVHDKITEYMFEGGVNGLKETLTAQYKSSAYADRIINEVASCLIFVGDDHVLGHPYMPEEIYCFGEQGSNDRAKTSGLTTIGEQVAIIMVPDGESVHVHQINPRTKFTADDGIGDNFGAEDIVSYDEIKAKGDSYVSPILVLLPISESIYGWCALSGIQAFSKLEGDDFQDAREINPVNTEMERRIAASKPINLAIYGGKGDVRIDHYAQNSSTPDKYAMRSIVASLNTEDMRRKMVRTGLASPSDSDQDYVDKAATVIKMCNAVDKAAGEGAGKNMGQKLTDIAAIAKEYTGAVNQYISDCPAVMERGLANIVQQKVYSVGPTISQMITFGDIAVRASVARFACELMKDEDSDTSGQIDMAIRFLFNAVAVADYLKGKYKTGEEIAKNQKALGHVKTFMEQYGQFVRWASENVPELKSELKTIDEAVEYGNTDDAIKLLVDPTSVQRWTSWISKCYGYAVSKSGGMQNQVYAELIKNIDHLVNSWSGVVNSIKTRGLTTADIGQVRNILVNLSGNQGGFTKFNEMYTPTQLLITLRKIGHINTAEEETVDTQEMNLNNIDLSDTREAAPVSVFDPENKNALDLELANRQITGDSGTELYTGQDEKPDNMAGFRAQMDDESVKDVDKLLLGMSHIGGLVAQENDYKDLFYEMKSMASEDGIGVTANAQNANVEAIKRKLAEISTELQRARDITGKFVEKNVLTQTIYRVVSNKMMSVDDIKRAEGIFDTANDIAVDLVDERNGVVNAYTKDDTSTIAQLLSVLGASAFSPDFIDMGELSSMLGSLRQYVAHASGNPASVKAIDYAVKEVSQYSDSQNNSVETNADLFVVLAKLMNSIGRLVKSDANDNASYLNSVKGLHYDRPSSFKKVEKGDLRGLDLDNPIDAFARARIRPLSLKNTGEVTDTERLEANMYVDSVFDAMKENPTLAKYAYALGKAMDEFGRSVVSDDDRFSTNERLNRQFNSIYKSVVDKNMLYGDIAKTLPQRIVLNAIIDDERLGDKTYKRTRQTVENMTDNSNLQLLDTSFKSVGQGKAHRLAGNPLYRKTSDYSMSYAKGDGELVQAGRGQYLDEEGKEEIISSWFNPDNPTSSTNIIDRVKSARQYVCGVIADRIGTLDEFSDEVNLTNGKTSDELKAAVRSIHALASDLDTPIADVIVATTSLGQKNARKALLVNAREALTSGREDYSVDDMAVVANEINVFPQRLSSIVSYVDSDWVDGMTRLVSAIPEQMSVADVVGAVNMYCGSLSQRQKMMADENTKVMYRILANLQSMSSEQGVPIGYFGDNRYEANQNLKSLFKVICSFKTADNTWDDVAERIGAIMSESVERGDRTRKVDGGPTPSQPARERIAHLRMNPYYSYRTSGDTQENFDEVQRILVNSGYAKPSKSGQSVKLPYDGVVIDKNTFRYWVGAIASDFEKNHIEIDDEVAGDVFGYMDYMIMTLMTGIVPKWLDNMKADTKDVDLWKSENVRDVMKAIVKMYHPDIQLNRMVKLADFGYVTMDTFRTMCNYAYMKASETGLTAQTVCENFKVAEEVLTRQSMDKEGKPVYSLDDLQREHMSRDTTPETSPEDSSTTETVNATKKSEPAEVSVGGPVKKSKPVAQPVGKDDDDDDDDDDVVPEVHGAGE